MVMSYLDRGAERATQKSLVSREPKIDVNAPLAIIRRIWHTFCAADLPKLWSSVSYRFTRMSVGRGNEDGTMKVRASIKRICEKCKLIRRKGVVRVICEDPRHKQRQG